MYKTGKKWGTTELIFEKNNTEVHRIVGKLNGKSSMHKHESKWSMFYVEKGKVKISVEKNDYNLTDITILETGESTVLKPNEFHMFEILEDQTVCYEIYWTQLDPNDIVRKTCGS